MQCIAPIIRPLCCPTNLASSLLFEQYEAPCITISCLTVLAVHALLRAFDSASIKLSQRQS
jgi:hypothetical protein